MKNRLLTILPLLVFVVAGCNSGPEEKVAPTSGVVADKVPSGGNVNKTTTAEMTGAAPTGGSADASPTKNPDGIGGGVGAPPPKPPTPVSPIPAPTNIKHEGYQYSGAENTRPVDLELTMSSQPNQVTTGAQIITHTNATGDKAFYTVERTGGLQMLGTEEWMIDKDGVFTTKSSKMSFGDRAMELPADPKPGMSWTVHPKADKTSGNMDMLMTFKIIGKETVTTKKGMHPDALRVEQIGEGTVQSHKIRTVSQNWYVKGLGLVKAEMKSTADGKTDTIMIQER